MIVRTIARPMLASIFIVGGFDAARDPNTKVDAANPLLGQAIAAMPDSVTDRVPTDDATLIRINGAIQVGAGLMLATGRWPRIASAVLAGSVVPTTVAGHDFWNEADPAARRAQRTQFLKNLGLLGGLLIAAVDTEGKPSLGWRGRRAARHAQEAVVAALPGAQAAGSSFGAGLHTAAERARELGAEAADRGSHLLDVAKVEGPVLAEQAREWGADAAVRGERLLDVAKERGAELADQARDWSADAAERGEQLLASARAEGEVLAERGQDLGKDASKRAKKARKRAQKRLDKAADTAAERAEVVRAQAERLRESTVQARKQLTH